jgi:hypothetical protein
VFQPIRGGEFRLRDEVEFDSDDTCALEPLQRFREDQVLRIFVSRCRRSVEPDKPDIGFSAARWPLNRHHAMRFLRPLQFGVFLRRHPQRVHLRLPAALHDIREANGFFHRRRHGSRRRRWHRSIFPLPLSVRPRPPGAKHADAGEKPEQEGGQAAQSEPGETQEEEQNGESCEKEVHGAIKVSRVRGCAMGQNSAQWLGAFSAAALSFQSPRTFGSSVSISTSCG